MVSLNWCNHLLTFVHVDILNGTKNTVPPKWQTTHFLALSSTGHNFWLFMLPGNISCQPCHSKCPCHVTRHLQLHRAPHGTLRAQRVPAHRGNEFLPEVDQLSVDSDGYGSHSMQNRPKMNGQQTMIMIYIYTTCLVPTVWSFDTFLTRAHSKWTHFSSLLLRSFAWQCHTPSKSRTSGGSFTNPCFGTWTSPLKSAEAGPKTSIGKIWGSSSDSSSPDR